MSRTGFCLVNHTKASPPVAGIPAVEVHSMHDGIHWLNLKSSQDAVFVYRKHQSIEGKSATVICIKGVWKHILCGNSFSQVQAADLIIGEQKLKILPQKINSLFSAIRMAGQPFHLEEAGSHRFLLPWQNGTRLHCTKVGFLESYCLHCIVYFK